MIPRRFIAAKNERGEWGVFDRERNEFESFLTKRRDNAQRARWLEDRLNARIAWKNDLLGGLISDSDEAA